MRVRFNATVTQLVEYLICNEKVVGSYPTCGSQFMKTGLIVAALINPKYKWIEISDAEKQEFKKLASEVPSTPTFFNLKSDRDDAGGHFAKMTREDVVGAAEKSARWLMNGHIAHGEPAVL